MKKLSIMFSLVAMLALCACNHATFIKPDKAAVEFTLEGGDASVGVSADGSWEVKECPEWVTTEVRDSTLVVKARRNDTSKVREGNIVLASGDVTATVAIKQMTKCTHITTDVEAVEFEKEGGSKTVNIDTDGAVQVVAPEGFTAEYAGGVLTVSATANEGGQRGGDITLKADEVTTTVKATQSGNVCPTCNGTGKVICSKCRGKGYYLETRGEPSNHGCPKCGGSGVEASTFSDLRKGTGKMTCPTCGGSGS